MGNAQEKPPGSGEGGEQATPGSRRRGRGAGSVEKPQSQTSPQKGVANGTQREKSHGEESQDRPAVDTSYLDAPAGALPPHLGRLKNEGNHLFKNGQFGAALEKYTQAIDGCADAGKEEM